MDSPSDPARRAFLFGIPLTAWLGACGQPAEPTASTSSKWRNWSGNQRANPLQMLTPQTEQELAAAVKQAGNIRVFGGSHSFSPLVPGADTLLSIEALNGLIEHDAYQLTARLRAGTRIAACGPLLQEIGQGLINEADINLQSLAGAISTATHGTGLGLQCYSGYVRGLRLLLADGQAVDCSPQHNNELFQAARAGLGAIGIITEVTLQNRAAYRLQESVEVLPLQQALDTAEREKQQRRHIEFFAFPFGDKAILKRTNLSMGQPDTPPPEDDNALLQLACDTTRRFPWLNGPVQKLLGAFVSQSQRVGPSYQLLASPRSVGFNEMEYAVPLANGPACLLEVVAAVRESGIQVFFPIEYRYVAADDVWLSPYYQQACAVISVHQYAPQDYLPLFARIEPILRKHGGRPHWGKLHTLGYRQLRELYPRFDDFCRVRQQADPQGKWLNPHLRHLLLETT